MKKKAISSFIFYIFHKYNGKSCYFANIFVHFYHIQLPY